MSGRAIEIRLLGSLTIIRNGVEHPLPASRKVRALLAFLAVARATVQRSRLIEMLCDSSSDPRGELRWCLSRLRSVLDDERTNRIEAQGDAITLDLSDCLVDIAEIARLQQAGIERLDLDTLRKLRGLFAGDFAAGLELDRCPEFSSWLSAQRRQFRANHVGVLEQMVARLGADQSTERAECLEAWLQLAPFDRRVHETLLDTLLAQGRIKDCEAHLANTIRVFEAEGLDWLPIREHWKNIRNRAAEPTRISAPETLPITELALPNPGVARRASVCVMPFVDRSSTARGGLADGLTEDIITRLAKLRALFVIARGSVFRLGERDIPPQEAARLLNVDYVASGSVRLHNDRVYVRVELSETIAGRIVWAEEFNDRASDAFGVVDEISNKIVASIAGQIEGAERNRAVLKPPGSLDAWEAYHRGLWHVYRFNANDNERAAHYFRMALGQDRTFARAHVGLSFTHFQNAFLGWTRERERDIALAYETAGDSLVADDHDPAAHWAMGRALWLFGRLDESVRELESSVELSPNFALGHYALGFVHSQSGDASAAITSTDYSRQLSPFDPLLFAMLATRAMALFRLQRYAEAAEWARKAALRPNAHINVQAIAANCLAAAGRVEEGREILRSLRRTAPNYKLDDFLRAFHFDTAAAAEFQRSAMRVGLDA